jgi:transposase
MKNKNRRIKSSKLTLKFANAGKKDELRLFLDEYRRVVMAFVDIFWEGVPKLETCNIPTKPEKEFTDMAKTWLSARAIQAAVKQASGIVRGVIRKQKSRLWVIRELEKEGKTTEANKLQKVFDNAKVSKPAIKDVKAQLDYRFGSLEKGKNKFEYWLKIGSIGNKMKISLPTVGTKHFNKMLQSGKLLKSFLLSDKYAFFAFELAETKEKALGETIGIDIGAKTVLSSFQKGVSTVNNHGYDLSSIMMKLKRRKKGSKGFARAVAERTNYINWSVNQFDFSGVKTLRLEDIKYLRRGKRSSRFLSHWCYKSIFDKLLDKCSQQGVLVERVSPAGTSQRCPICGWTQKSNRRGKLFHCKHCHLKCDADLVGSANIGLPIPAMPISLFCSKNKTGFLWHPEICLSQGEFFAAMQAWEPIVLTEPKANPSEKSTFVVDKSDFCL